MKKVTTSLMFLLLICSIYVVKAQGCERQSTFPTLCISTAGNASINSKNTYVNGTMTVLADPGTPGAYSGGIRIRGRGNSTWSLEKKPYRINLDVSSSLLGLPASAKNWVLLANHSDKTLIRNSLAFEISERLGLPYTCAYKPVDVVLNGQYIGSYLLTDHVDIRPNRVDIDELSSAAEDLIEPNISGGYMGEIDGFATAEPDWVSTNRGMLITLKSPENNATQKDYFRNYLNSFENRLFSSTPSDGPNGYFEMVDKESLVNWYIACELTGNSDAFWSVKFFKRRGDNRFLLGPLWDFDISFDNDDRIANARYRKMSDAAHSPLLKQWIARHRQDDVFMRAVKKRWNELKEEGFENFILQKLTNLSDTMVSSGSAAKNYTRWNVLNTKVLREVLYQGTYQQHVAFLHKYMEDRLEWFDNEINGVRTDTYYKIGNIQTGLNMSAEATGSTTITQRSDVGNDERQVWQLRKLDNSFYRIYHVASGKYMSISNTGDNSQTASLVAGDPASPLQQWRITQGGLGSYLILSRNERQGAESRDLPAINGTEVRLRSLFASGQDLYFESWVNTGRAVKWLLTPTESPLPVLLNHFSATLHEQAVKLSWQVTEVTNPDYFEIERLEDGIRPMALGRVENRGEGHYEWTDFNPNAGNNYYRLKIMDNDGSYENSRIITIEAESATKPPHVYPNPVRGEVIAPIGGLISETVEISVFGLNGRRVLQQTIKRPKHTEIVSVPVKGLPEGLYHLQIRGGNQSSRFRFLVAGD